ncbi:hypothetical protein SMD20_39535 [Nonomuraea sp. LP-02]|uniref:hypothetical protein n=1 Tax=Nonomuraea sp. LP-02 TaxID=3097960 RepID=UPI002E34B9A9|nr:hypothetical protein [Nonomuraea sp. LP-02]MED7930376.1 hypothetical protein [Nonomuraea sp. LP-02]
MAIHNSEMTATESVPAGTETAVTIPDDAAPLTAPDGPATATPADPATDADGRVAAVWAALNAKPGGSATVIGAAAGLSRMAAGKILNQFEADGRARRELGVSDGGMRGRAADRWFPITADAESTDSTDNSVSAPALGAPDVAPSEVTTPNTDTPDADVVLAPEEEDLQAAAVATGPAPVDERADKGNLTEEPVSQPEDLNADEAAGQEPDGTDSDLGSAPEAAASELVPEPEAEDPAWARAKAELAEIASLLSGAILAKDEGNAVMALGCLEMAMTKVTSAHRTARAVLTGTVAPARAGSSDRSGTSASGAGAGDMVRQGGLRDMVHAHLVAFPDKDFTPYEIGKVINRSSGAVANALDRLVSLGEAVLSCERPRRFALATADADGEADAEVASYGS